MRDLFSLKNIRNLVIVTIVFGIIIMAMSGYLTPVFSFIFNPVISTQSWLSERYVAFRDFFTSPRDMATLRAQNQALEQEVAQLQSEIVALQESLSQSEILFTLLDFARSHPEHEYIAATVIGREISPYLQYVIIDKGSNHGIRYGMPVVTEEGLVGRIDAVIANASRVKLITDASMTVNVRLKTANVDAQTTGSITGEISLGMVPQDAEVADWRCPAYQWAWYYPPNIFVGQVLSMQSSKTRFSNGICASGG